MKYNSPTFYGIYTMSLLDHSLLDEIFPNWSCNLLSVYDMFLRLCDCYPDNDFVVLSTDKFSFDNYDLSLYEVQE